MAHYFPPVSSSGAKRMEALAKYFALAGRRVTVLTTVKTPASGPLTEAIPAGVEVIEIDWLGRAHAAMPPQPATAQVALSRGTGRIKALVMNMFGQALDPRLTFAFALLNPFLARRIRDALRAADVIVATCPPYPPMLGAIFAKWRFGVPVVLDYRDQLSFCHEMPGGRFAKWLELRIDRFLTRHANAVVTISAPMRDYYAGLHPDVGVILNGYDPEKLEAARAAHVWQPRAPGSPLVIRYLGLVTPGRIPVRFLAGLAQLHAAGGLAAGALRLEFYGDCALVGDYVQSRYPELVPFLHFSGAVPYAQALALMVTADHVLFCENVVAPKDGEEKSAAGILPTKLYEYLASGRPVLADLDPTTLAGSFIARAEAGHFVADTEAAFAEHVVSAAFWSPPVCETNDFVRSLSRAAQADQYLAELDRVIVNAA